MITWTKNLVVNKKESNKKGILKKQKILKILIAKVNTKAKIKTKIKN